MMQTTRPIRTGIMRAAAMALVAYSLAPAAWAAGAQEIGANFLWLALILLVANVAGRVVERIGMPGVLGELLVGIVLGNLALVGIVAADGVGKDPVFAFLAELGVVILLFQIGLESSLKELREVGGRALAVAVIGVVVPFALGTFLVGPWLMPGQSYSAYLFLGATLTATSVGITGRVFRDLGKLGIPEARIVLGAAIIDDVLGLVLLAVVTSIVQQGSIGTWGIVVLIVEAIAFLAGSIVIGRAVAPWLSRGLARIDAGVAMKLALILSVCLSMAWLAHLIGLASIVGAFAAGLVLEPIFLSDFDDPEIVRKIRALLRGEGAQVREIRAAIDQYSGHHHHNLLAPLGYFFVPIFLSTPGCRSNSTPCPTHGLS